MAETEKEHKKQSRHTVTNVREMEELEKSRN